MKQFFRLSFSLFFFFFLLAACFYLSGIFSQEPAQEALYYQNLTDKVVQCRLCPRQCIIAVGKRGFCGVRENRDGILYSLSYAKAVALHVDPIEKKPLFHFLPASSAFSVATAGCNLRCKFCQNWEISQRRTEEVNYRYLQPRELIEAVKSSGSPVIAYTYSEPTIFYEYMLEAARLARKQGLKNIMHSSGYINEAPLKELVKYLDAANIDLKGFSDDYYSRMSEGQLEPVLKTLKILKKEGVHLEITNLVLPGYNDDMATITRMCLWIKENLGSDVPLHFSRFTPMYKMLALSPTPVDSLEKARQIALDCGLKYVYIGNVWGHPAESTYCPRCKKIVIKRAGFSVLENHLIEGSCEFCHEKITGVWN